MSCPITVRNVIVNGTLDLVRQYELVPIDFSIYDLY